MKSHIRQVKEERTSHRLAGQKTLLPSVRFFLCAAVLCASGCASEEWSRRDTVAEITWQVMNVIDTKQTINIQYTPGIREVNTVSRAILGSQPRTHSVYQLHITYAISHYAISRTLPRRWRKYWHGATLLGKGWAVYHNNELGL